VHGLEAAPRLIADEPEQGPGQDAFERLELPEAAALVSLRLDPEAMLAVEDARNPQVPEPPQLDAPIEPDDGRAERHRLAAPPPGPSRRARPPLWPGRRGPPRPPGRCRKARPTRRRRAGGGRSPLGPPSSRAPGAAGGSPPPADAQRGPAPPLAVLLHGRE